MIIWPEIESAVQTMPASAITKNIPVVPETPNRRRMTDEMMIVSIVIPETGLRAIVAIAFAATEAKKNEKTSVRTSAIDDGRTSVSRACRRRAATPIALRIVPRRIAMSETSRSVRSVRGAAAARNAFAAIPNDPATIFSDFRMPKMPAVAIAPTPTYRT